MNSDKLRTIYEEGLNYLYENKPDDITDEQLEEYFRIPDKYKTKNRILERLCGTLQNYQSMPNVIGFYNKKERKEGFKRVLLNYNEKKILDNYASYIDLREAFAREFDLDRTGFGRKNNLWTRYSKAVLSACEFMKQFEDADDFNTFVERFSYNETTAVALPLLLDREIYGLGFALGCDFLKEIGYGQYPKPDVHLIDIFSELGLCEKDQLSCYKAIIEMANAAGESPFKVDKVFWLIGSGDFSSGNYEGKVTRNKKDFIERMMGNM